MDQQQQQRINEAAGQFTDALAHSYKAISERGVSAQQLNAKLTQQFFSGAIGSVRGSAEQTRDASQDLAEQTRRGQEAARTLTQESVGAYMDFVNSMFSFYQAGPQAVQKGAEEAQGEITKGGGAGSNGDTKESLREDIRSIIRESVRRSEAGSREEPQEDGRTLASEESRAAAEGPPIEDYDSLNVSQISERLEGLSVEELEQLRRYEAANKNRSTLYRRIDDMMAASTT